MAVNSAELRRLRYGKFCCDDCASRAYFRHQCPHCELVLDSDDALTEHREGCEESGGSE